MIDSGLINCLSQSEHAGMAREWGTQRMHPNHPETVWQFGFQVSGSQLEWERLSLGYIETLLVPQTRKWNGGKLLTDRDVYLLFVKCEQRVEEPLPFRRSTSSPIEMSNFDFLGVLSEVQRSEARPVRSTVALFRWTANLF